MTDEKATGPRIEKGPIITQVLVDFDKGLVVLQFDKSVTWIGFSADGARELAEKFQTAANALNNEGTKH